MKTTIVALAVLVLSTDQLANISAGVSGWTSGGAYPPAAMCIKGCPAKPIDSKGSKVTGQKGSTVTLPNGQKGSTVRSK